jgi:Skp family chaperone for outer membrane proteins
LPRVSTRSLKHRPVRNRLSCCVHTTQLLFALFVAAFGEALREQVEERLRFYDTGVAPRKNVDVMGEVAATLNKGKKRAASDVDDMAVDAVAKKAKKDKKSKKDKKEKKEKKEVLVSRLLRFFKTNADRFSLFCKIEKR